MYECKHFCMAQYKIQLKYIISGVNKGGKTGNSLSLPMNYQH